MRASQRRGGVHHHLRIVYGPDAQAVGRQERQVEVTETVRRLGEFRDFSILTDVTAPALA
jgi:hypothetical protein